MNEPKRDLSASVLARLLKRAKQAGDEYQTVLAGFCFERFLYRLGQSPVRDRFVLKGAMMLRLWMDTPYRATRDLDLLRKGEGTPEAILSDIQGVCESPLVGMRGKGNVLSRKPKAPMALSSTQVGDFGVATGGGVWVAAGAKDGVTVAKEIELQDAFENMGAQAGARGRFQDLGRRR